MKNLQKGQALVSLLVFMIIAISIATGAVLLLITGSVNTTKVAKSSNAQLIAESGAENGLVNLLRRTDYTGETLIFPDGQAVITVTGSNPYTITSTGTSGDFRRRIEVSVEFVNNKMNVLSWREVF